MALDSVSKVGKLIGDLSRSQDTIKENINPNDPSAINTVILNDRITMGGTVSLYKRRMSGVMIIENPVFGVVETDAYPIGPFCVLDHPSWSILDDCMLAETGEEYERTLLRIVDISTNQQFLPTELTIPVVIPVSFSEEI